MPLPLKEFRLGTEIDVVRIQIDIIANVLHGSVHVIVTDVPEEENATGTSIVPTDRVTVTVTVTVTDIIEVVVDVLVLDLEIVLRLPLHLAVLHLVVLRVVLRVFHWVVHQVVRHPLYIHHPTIHTTRVFRVFLNLYHHTTNNLVWCLTYQIL